MFIPAERDSIRSQSVNAWKIKQFRSSPRDTFSAVEQYDERVFREVGHGVNPNQLISTELHFLSHRSAMPSARFHSDFSTQSLILPPQERYRLYCSPGQSLYL